MFYKFVLFLLLFLCLSFRYPNPKYHFWYSHEQAKRVYRANGCDLVAKINGEYHFYSEAQTVKERPHWEDSKYLGYGEYSHCEKR